MGSMVDFIKIKRKLDACCLNHCTKCGQVDCLIKYSKDIVESFYKKHERIYENGIEKIPGHDSKLYAEEKVIDAVVEILNQCRQCNTNHEKDCSINVIRASLERILLNENLDDYRGSVLQHIMEITKINPCIGEKILNKYKETRNKD